MTMLQECYPILDLKEIKMFAVWKWQSEELNKNCAICRGQMVQPCNECEVNNENDHSVENCIIVQSSNCGHAFHRHCIRGWIKRVTLESNISQTCPLCSLNWEINQEVEVKVEN